MNVFTLAAPLAFTLSAASAVANIANPGTPNEFFVPHQPPLSAGPHLSDGSLELPPPLYMPSPDKNPMFEPPSHKPVPDQFLIPVASPAGGPARELPIPPAPSPSKGPKLHGEIPLSAHTAIIFDYSIKNESGRVHSGKDTFGLGVRIDFGGFSGSESGAASGSGGSGNSGLPRDTERKIKLK